MGVIKKLRRRLDPQRRFYDRYLAEAKADEYINWACSMIGGWLEPGAANLAGFVYAMQHLPATGAIVEIGSFLGASTNVLTYLSRKHAGGRVVSTLEGGYDLGALGASAAAHVRALMSA